MKYEMRSCGELGHKSRYCDTPSKWTLCAKEDHDFFKCPQSYAYKARAGPPSSPEEELTDARERERVAEPLTPRGSSIPRATAELVVTTTGPSAAESQVPVNEKWS